MDPTTSGASRPQQRTPGSGGGREDAWSEGATETLIQAWGDRYISLNRGNLRQKDWREVADAVNARENGVKARKTDVQCKNRIDTLKKKYKIEKAKPPPSKWSFFYRLDSLIGTSSVTPKKKLAGAATVKSRMNPKPELYSGVSESTESSSDDALIDNEEEEEEEEEEDGEDLDDDDDEIGIGERVVKKKQHRMEDVNFSDGAACRELARAILKFGEIYERIESSKQQQMMELEKQRMQFTKELEFQKMNMFVDAQLELEKQALKRAKHASASEKKS